MIYYLEYDSVGNICHAAADPVATIVPLVNRVSFNGSDGKPLVSPTGVPLSLYNLPMIAPLGITATVYNSIIAGGGVGNFTYDIATSAVVAKVVDAPTT
jgi:hypothetical protein